MNTTPFGAPDDGAPATPTATSATAAPRRRLLVTGGLATLVVVAGAGCAYVLLTGLGGQDAVLGPVGAPVTVTSPPTAAPTAASTGAPTAGVPPVTAFAPAGRNVFEPLVNAADTTADTPADPTPDPTPDAAADPAASVGTPDGGAAATRLPARAPTAHAAPVQVPTTAPRTSRTTRARATPRSSASSPAVITPSATPSPTASFAAASAVCTTATAADAAVLQGLARAVSDGDGVNTGHGMGVHVLALQQIADDSTDPALNTLLTAVAQEAAAIRAHLVSGQPPAQYDTSGGHDKALRDYCSVVQDPLAG